MYSKDFSKIYNQNIEVTKVLHKNISVWSSVFDGDFSNPDLWEMGGIDYAGSLYSDANDARTKDFFEVPENGLTLLNVSDPISGSMPYFFVEIVFYRDKIHSTYISKSYPNNTFPQTITVPNNAEYYKLVFYNGIGAQRDPMRLPEYAIEANIQIVPTPDFVKVNGFWVYRGTKLEVEIPTHINGELVTSTSYMFSGSSSYQATPVTKVVLKNSNVTDMAGMFQDSKATTLDLSSFNTSSATNMASMFYNSKATTLDLSSFNTSNVTDVSYMFMGSSATTGYARTQADANKFNASNYKPEELNFVVKPELYLAKDSDFVNVIGQWIYRGDSTWVEIPTHINGELVTSTTRMFREGLPYEATPVTKVVLKHSNVTDMSFMFEYSSATTLDLSDFNTSNVTNMGSMFARSVATTLDLSSFDTSNVTNMGSMFLYSPATTGYARTQTDANKFNASSNKPTGLRFALKPPPIEK